MTNYKNPQKHALFQNRDYNCFWQIALEKR